VNTPRHVRIGHKRWPNGELVDVEDFSRWDDAALLAEREHSAASFAVLYRRHVGVVLRFFARRGVDATDAADLTAETFAAALLARGRYRRQEGTARAWLLGIAGNKLADSRRRFARERRAQRRLAIEPIPLSEQDVAEFEALRSEEDEAAIDALASLPDGQRAAVYARLVQEESYEQIGRMLGIAEPAARQRVRRGLARLRDRLKEER
jgi:RNA polymerase sigma factor (sigma-70 family)